MEFVSRKYVIYVGKRTINGLLFSQGSNPTSFSKKTLSDEVTSSFFQTNILDDKYLRALIGAINVFVTNYTKVCSKDEITMYASSEFNKCLSENDKTVLKMKVFSATGVHIFIMSQELEQLYISNLIPSFTKPRFFLRITSTTTIIYYFNENGKMSQFRFDDIGSATLPRIIRNNFHLNIKIEERIIKSDAEMYIQKLCTMCNEKIIKFKEEIQCGSSNILIYLGGEVDFMKAFDYELEPNKIFKDPEHEFQIEFKDFYEQSINNVISKTQSELSNIAFNLEEAWKSGMKSCTLIALVICKMLECTTIIPSNSKEFFGMYYKNFKNVAITGSRERNYTDIKQLVRFFSNKGIKVNGTNFELKDETDAELQHLIAINECDTLIVCNSDGYIGDSTLFDIGYAIAKGKRVIATNRPNTDVFKLIGVEIGLYGG